MEPSPPTTSAAAGANTAATPATVTELNAALTAKTTPATVASAGRSTPPVTSPTAGSPNLWKPAVTAAGLDFNVRVHDLRHAHASCLLAGGAEVQTVKERLGDGRLRTTEKYLHTPRDDDTALDALRRIQNRPAC
jgi:integrase